MNTLNCGTGFASDLVFRNDLGLEACNVDLAQYDTAAGILLVIRFIFLFLVIREWMQLRSRHGRGSAHPTTGWRQRRPYIASLQAMLMILWILFFLLVRFDVASSVSGGSFVLWVLTFDGFAVYAMLRQNKIIRLGKKLIPFSRSGADPTKMAESTYPWARLEKFDSVLRIAVALELACTLAQTIIGLILGPLYPGRFVFLQAAFGLECGFMALNLFCLVYQLQRLIGVVQASEMNKQYKVKQDIIRKMRVQQFYWILTGSPGIITNLLLTVEVIPAVWYILLYWIIIETLVSSLAIVHVMTSCLRNWTLQDHQKDTVDSTPRVETANAQLSARVVS